jgi:anti-sigma factor (TIGR02949 family)
LEKSLHCSVIRDRLYHFQADELPETERREFAAHLDGCPECALRLEIEDDLLRSIKARLVRETAPPELRTRVRAALEREAPEPTRWSWLPTGVGLVPLAASIFLAVLLIPLLAQADGAARGVVPVEQEVLVVDFDCDRAGRSVDQQIACANPHHLNALKHADGGYWNIGLDLQAARRLTVDRAMRGHRVRVRGSLYPHIRTVSLTGYEDLGLVRTAVSRRSEPFAAPSLLLAHL